MFYPRCSGRFGMACIVYLTLLAPAVGAEALSGIWRVAGESVWISIKSVCSDGDELEDCEVLGQVVRSDDSPELVGQTILRELRPAGAEGRWDARLYSPRLAREVDAQINSTSPDKITLHVRFGFIARSVVWQREQADLLQE